jgi:hypothetical protein
MLFVATKKLKSSPKRKENPKILADFWNWNLTSSAYFYFMNKRVRSVGAICRARQVFVG